MAPVSPSPLRKSPRPTVRRSTLIPPDAKSVNSAMATSDAVASIQMRSLGIGAWRGVSQWNRNNLNSRVRTTAAAKASMPMPKAKAALFG